jgi:uncharacterized protein YlxW (UPF0749 family)
MSDAQAPEDTQPARDESTPRSLLSQLAFQPSRPHLFIGVLFLVLGLLVTLAIVRPGEDEPWRTARTEDLVQILDDLGARQDRLEVESARLAALQGDLEAGSTVDAVAEAQRQLEALQVLTGTTPVVGPGLTIVITDPEGAVDAPVLLDAVQELRDAGAEAIQVGSSRVVVDTWFADDDGTVVVNGEPLTAPVRIVAIGDPETMAAAVSIPGGLADSVRTRGADFAASTSQALSISVTVPETTD